MAALRILALLERLPKIGIQRSFQIKVILAQSLRTQRPKKYSATTIRIAAIAPIGVCT
jgi:hypothetical protein